MCIGKMADRNGFCQQCLFSIMETARCLSRPATARKLLPKISVETQFIRLPNQISHATTCWLNSLLVAGCSMTPNISTTARCHLSPLVVVFSLYSLPVAVYLYITLYFKVVQIQMFSNSSKLQIIINNLNPIVSTNDYCVIIPLQHHINKFINYYYTEKCQM